jgi:very-short-patch-repair endonuclease
MTYNPAVVISWMRNEHGLPVPKLEYRFHPDRKWRFDFAWPDEMVALEVEGGVWSHGRHGRGSGIVKDIEKYNAAAQAGWMVLRVLPKDLCTERTATMLRMVL